MAALSMMNKTGDQVKEVKGIFSLIECEISQWH